MSPFRARMLAAAAIALLALVYGADAWRHALISSKPASSAEVAIEEARDADQQMRCEESYGRSFDMLSTKLSPEQRRRIAADTCSLESKDQHSKDRHSKDRRRNLA